MPRRATNATYTGKWKQLELYPPLALVCPDHDARHVCDRCPEQYETDFKGFAHHSLRKGRIALRHCRCGRLVTFDHWIAQGPVDQCDECVPKAHPPCKRPVCKPACGLHATCPYEQSRHRKRFRARLRKQQAVGPLDELSGKWARDIERWDPWGTEAPKAERDK